MSGSTQLIVAVIDLDVYLRKMTVDGSRRVVNAGDVAGPLSLTIALANKALTRLAAIADSGCRNVGKGDFEYKAPMVYPIALAELKDKMRTQTPTRSLRNAHVQRDVVTWMRDHPDVIQTLAEVAEGINALPGSVANALVTLAEVGYIEALPQLGRGVYIFRSTTQVASYLTGDIVTSAERVEDVPLSTPIALPPVRLVAPPTSGEVKPKVKARVFEEVGRTSSGAILVREHSSTTIYTLQEL